MWSDLPCLHELLVRAVTFSLTLITLHLNPNIQPGTYMMTTPELVTPAVTPNGMSSNFISIPTARCHANAAKLRVTYTTTRVNRQHLIIPMSPKTMTSQREKRAEAEQLNTSRWPKGYAALVVG